MNFLGKGIRQQFENDTLLKKLNIHLNNEILRIVLEMRRHNFLILEASQIPLISLMRSFLIYIYIYIHMST